jgi:hypothetical protein
MLPARLHRQKMEHPPVSPEPRVKQLSRQRNCWNRFSYEMSALESCEGKAGDQLPGHLCKC